MIRSERFGLYREVVFSDIYRLKDTLYKEFLASDPDVIIDIGANVGVFCKLARLLFPTSKIVAIEPNPGNFAELKDTFKDDNCVLIQTAVGAGKIFHATNTLGGAHERYMSAAVGYEGITKAENYEPMAEEGLRLSGIVENFVKEGQKYIVKVDCEGAENSIISHEPSVEALKRAEYVCMEFHWFAQTHEEIGVITAAVATFQLEMAKTHTCTTEHVMFYARKK